jgi:CBS domain-containing protein
MRVENVMSKDARICSAEDTLNHAACLMWEADCGFLPVIDERRHVIGVVTDRDLLMGAYTQGQPLTNATVGSVMSREVCACAPDDSLVTAEKLMQDRRVRRLPVVDGSGEMVGVITLGDLARSSQSNTVTKAIGGVMVAKTLAAICEPRPAMALAAE